jgi:hypothetical protein
MKLHDHLSTQTNTSLNILQSKKPHTHRSTPRKSTPLKTCSHGIQTHQQKPPNMATRKDDIIINSRGCLLKGTTFLILLLKDFSFRMPIPPSYFLFFISLSFRRHPIVLPDSRLSASKLTRKSQSFFGEESS